MLAVRFPCQIILAIIMHVSLIRLTAARDSSGHGDATLLNGSQAAWTQLELSHSRVVGSGVYREKVDSNAELVLPIHFAMNGPWMRFTALPGLGQNVPKSRRFGEVQEYAAALNSSYGFVVTKRDASAGWVVEELGAGAEEMEQCKTLAKTNWHQFVASPWSIGGTPFTELFKHPGITISRSAVLERQGRSLIEVQFVFRPTNAEVRDHNMLRPIWALRSGTLVFWPAASWSLTESDLAIELTPTLKVREFTQIDYAEAAGSARPIRRVRRTADRGKSSNVRSFEFDRYDFQDAPESYFRLTAFDLPENSAVARTSSTVRKWFRVVGIIGLLSVAVVVVIRKARRQPVCHASDAP